MLFWLFHDKNDVMELEEVERSLARMSPGSENFTYGESLDKLNVFNLEKRGLKR